MGYARWTRSRHDEVLGDTSIDLLEKAQELLDAMPRQDYRVEGRDQRRCTIALVVTRGPS